MSTTEKALRKLYHLLLLICSCVALIGYWSVLASPPVEKEAQQAEVTARARFNEMISKAVATTQLATAASTAQPQTMLQPKSPIVAQVSYYDENGRKQTLVVLRDWGWRETGSAIRFAIDS